MKCSSCGRELDAGDIFCSECGTRVNQTKQKNGRAEYKKTAQSSEVQALTVKGIDFYNQNDYDAVIEVLNKAIKLNPDYANNYHWRGRCYYEKEEYNRAIWDFNKAIELNPSDEFSYRWRSKCFYFTGDTDRAIHDLKEVIRLNPDDEEARDLLRKLH